MSNFVDNLRWALLCTAYFPILSVLIFVGLAVLSLPYVLFSTAWLICLSLLLIAFILPDILGIFGLLIIWSGQGFLALILVPLIVLTFCAIYTVS